MVAVVLLGLEGSAFLGFEGAIPLADSQLGQRACLGEPRYGLVGLREATAYQ
jgi:hypothetical protein